VRRVAQELAAGGGGATGDGPHQQAPQAGPIGRKVAELHELAKVVTNGDVVFSPTLRVEAGHMHLVGRERAAGWRNHADRGALLQHQRAGLAAVEGDSRDRQIVLHHRLVLHEADLATRPPEPANGGREIVRSGLARRGRLDRRFGVVPGGNDVLGHILLPDPTDGRAQIVRRTDRGWIVNRIARQVVAEVQTEWATILELARFELLLSLLTELASQLGVEYLGSISEVSARPATGQSQP
jgi:hypothetical protein